MKRFHQLLLLILLGCGLYACNRHKAVNETAMVDEVDTDSILPEEENIDSINARVLVWMDSMVVVGCDTAQFFPQKKYKYVTAYTFNKGLLMGDWGLVSSIYDPEDHRMANTINDEVTLSAGQTRKLLGILNDTATYRWGEAACFEPHHAFVFYDAADTPVAWIDICFLCSQTRSEPYAPVTRWGCLSGTGNDSLWNFISGLPLKD